MGGYVERQMPDTLDLAQRAKLAFNAMLNVADDDCGGIPFFSGFLQSDEENPAWMSHGNWDYGSSHGRLVDTIALVRSMTGTSEGEEVEERYRRNLLSFIHENGLAYRRNSFTEEEIARLDAPFRPGASMIDQRAVILGLGTWYSTTDDEDIKGFADRHMAALKRIARKERESWYYPASEYLEDGWPSLDAVNTRLAYDPCAMWGRQVGPILTYHKLAGNADALELCENFVANITQRSGAFLPDGSWNGALEYRNGHFHTRMGTLLSIARFARFKNDARLTAWVERCYRWALEHWCTGFGWTPGDMLDQCYEHETCTLVDAIGCAITLAKCGYTEYWAVAERFLRGHLVESQLTDTSWVHQLDTKERDIAGYKTFYRVGDRLKGAFAGYAAPNDFVYSGVKGRGHIMDVQTCCVAAGGRGLFYGWSSIVTEERGRVSVNLLLNRATPWLDVESHLPYEGKVVLTVKQDLPDLVCRTPEWAPYGAIQVNYRHGDESKEETGRTLPCIDRVFLRLGAVKKGTAVTVTFPMDERETVETAVDEKYHVKWRGDNVVGISPGGSYLPLYKNKSVDSPAPIRTMRLYEGNGKFYE
ncbi:MAG: glycoside hydrolase family 127 protein [Oscillospiraceae bacterium]|nr:glycoside hydrolase family 127 protein [Oscillospiraceae bacterium]